MKNIINTISEMKQYLLLWGTQAFSGLGSAMTSFALVIWSYTQEGSALMTALLMVCSYAPYVICSIFAGALSDKWNKKATMLICDAMAALCTVAVLLLLKTENLQIWHLYLVNAVNGLMNTVQQPASEVATTALVPKKHYQRIGGLNYISRSANSILTPIIAMAFMGFGGIDAVIAFDLISFMVAFLVLLIFISIPEVQAEEKKKESILKSAKEGLGFLKKEKGVFALILFLAGINLVASMYNAAFPAMMLSRENGSEAVMATVNTVTGLTMLAGSFIATAANKPKNRVKTIEICLLVSMSTENFLLGLGRVPWVWCLATFLGWITIPMMSTNLEAILRLSIPQEIQGRVYAARNSLQFFTIPVGYFLGGILVDEVFEPFMALQKNSSLLVTLFGSGKGSGCALFFFALGFLGVGICLYFINNKHIKMLSENLQE